MTVFYEDEIMCEFVADVIVVDKVIVELKSVRRIIRIKRKVKDLKND
ncbi:GxxExxY protein [candidate division CSSED10-310 bacterium]|uniref:GxxExxY protein n=1 Tax=candidate division CSSED10-310 bacterium TaxID=2855610 RepID=A0ABV6Z368_UNCC1